jgi:hypothetical protein
VKFHGHFNKGLVQGWEIFSQRILGGWGDISKRQKERGTDREGEKEYKEITLRALNIFTETLYNECSDNCVQTWYCTIHLSVQVFICSKNRILHNQTIYRITEKVIPF